MAYKRKPHTPPPLSSDQLAQQALKDPDFQKKVLILIDLYAKRHPGIPLDENGIPIIKEGMKSGNRPMEIGDGNGNTRQYLTMAQCKDKLILNRIKTLSHDYAIDPYFIELCINSPIPQKWFGSKVQKPRAEIIETEEGLFIKVLPYTSLDDIRAAWSSVEIMKKAAYITYDPKTTSIKFFSGTNNRAIDDPAIVYAIHRARCDNWTFPEIFKRYQKGILPHYIGGKTERFETVNELEKYYDRNKPPTI